MTNQFTKLAFTDAVKEIQELMGSRKGYARLEQGPIENDTLSQDEMEFIAARDSFYMASVSETGWPYIQHRGGPKGLLKVLSERQIAFADFSGNRQYISAGNISKNDRVAMILVDYPSRTRLKILGRAKNIDASSDPQLISSLSTPGYKAKIERAFVIDIEAFDWNCPQHIVPRWTAEEIQEGMMPLRQRIQDLEEELRQLKKV
jgi:predicted pyridoxine 5'-phosphate oxidase superfamily flavin-nucleotide-binding protein